MEQRLEGEGLELERIVEELLPEIQARKIEKLGNDRGVGVKRRGANVTFRGRIGRPW